ncbi:amidohydrolase [Acidiferrimicrobium sp. IK]|uniref:amidohydrolase family protein n=1 Tax=Acidiferrimicrobium sp. IK TaxID=2871700 RepID=UPI0021CAFD64|nr:amidohydrolase family protein [Acidiferrimicrobium sp. IK]MCU4186639.1 amidohydrolase [Acidiferrimicrobium sp. IK]
MDLVDELGVKIIDCDTHVVEHYDLWTSRVPSKYGDKIPHVERDDNGVEWWVSSGTVLSPAAGLAIAGWKEPPPQFPAQLDMVDPRIWQPEGRLEIMDAYGIHTEVLYPNVGGFGAGRYTNFGDMDLALLLLQAYNDWLADFRRVAPSRYVPVMAVPFWDIDLSIKEMERCVGIGHEGMIFSQAPEDFGSPTLSDPHWDKLWAAAQEMQLSVNFHIGSGDATMLQMLHPSCGPHSNYAAFPMTFFLGNAKTVATIINGGICHRFPDLKFVSVESGVGWVPFALQALDWMWKECGVAREHPEYGMLPSEYFRRQIYACFWFETGDTLDAAIDYIGPDNILYETDFPHPTSMSPGPASSALVPREFINQNLGHLPHDTLRKILHDNAAKLYHLD